jgi:cytochrome b561
MAIIVVALYVLGDYMVDLDYYDPWYQSAPFWHKSFGLLLAILLILRVISRLAYAAPKEPAISGVIRYSAIFVHLALYVLLIGVMASGYLISTADGRGIAFFSWFEVASFGELFENQ